MKYIKTYENVINDKPEIGDYIMVQSYGYYNRIAVVKRYITGFEPDIMLEIEYDKNDKNKHKIFIDDVKHWGKTKEDVLKKEKELEKYLENLARRIEYNLNKFFDAKNIEIKKIEWVTPKYKNVKVYYEEGLRTPIRILLPLIFNQEYYPSDLKSKLEVYCDKLKEMNRVYKNESEFYKYNTIKLNKDEAEELLRSIKNDFAMNLTKKDAENYNL